MIRVPSRVTTGLSAEKYNGTIDILQMDVLPHIQFRPIAERKHSNRFPLIHLAVVTIPELGPLILRIPLVQPIAK